MRRLARIVACIALTLALSGAQRATPLQPTMPPTAPAPLATESTPPSVIAMPGSSVAVDDSTQVNVPEEYLPAFNLLTAVFSLFGGAATVHKVLQILGDRQQRQAKAEEHSQTIEITKLRKDMAKDEMVREALKTLAENSTAQLDYNARAAQERELLLKSIADHTLAITNFNAALDRHTLKVDSGIIKLDISNTAILGELKNLSSLTAQLLGLIRESHLAEPVQVYERLQEAKSKVTEAINAVEIAKVQQATSASAVPPEGTPPPASEAAPPEASA